MPISSCLTQRPASGAGVRRRLLLSAVSTALVLPMLAACSEGRSVEAYCDTMYEHQDRFEQTMAQAADAAASGTFDGALEGLAGAAGAVGDLQQMWSDLADAAPEEIRADVESIRDTYARQFERAEDGASDPLGVLAGSIADSLFNWGAASRVDAWTAEHC